MQTSRYQRILCKTWIFTHIYVDIRYKHNRLNYTKWEGQIYATILVRLWDLVDPVVLIKRTRYEKKLVFGYIETFVLLDRNYVSFQSITQNVHLIDVYTV